VDLKVDHDLPGIITHVTCKVLGQTGIEMEALTAASVAALTIYDMAKAHRSRDGDRGGGFAGKNGWQIGRVAA